MIIILVIITTGRGASREFSVFITNLIPSLDLQEKCQGFIRYNNDTDEICMFNNRDNISKEFADKLGLSIDETFAYVYGLLNSREYQLKYANDLKKDLARIPIVKNKDKYVEIGRLLIDLHLNYERIEPYNEVKIILSSNLSYKVNKMQFCKSVMKMTNL